MRTVALLLFCSFMLQVIPPRLYITVLVASAANSSTLGNLRETTNLDCCGNCTLSCEFAAARRTWHVAATHSAKYTATAALAARDAAQLVIRMNLQSAPSVAVCSSSAKFNKESRLFGCCLLARRAGDTALRRHG